MFSEEPALESKAINVSIGHQINELEVNDNGVNGHKNMSKNSQNTEKNSNNEASSSNTKKKINRLSSSSKERPKQPPPPPPEPEVSHNSVKRPSSKF